MRHSKLFALTLLSVTILTLTACNNTTTVKETVTESGAKTEEFYLQENGTYYVSEDIRKRLREYLPFCEWNDKEFEIGLQNFMKNFYSEAATVDDIFIIAEELSKNIIESREQAKQEKLSQQQETQEESSNTSTEVDNTQNNENQENTSGNSSTEQNNTEESTTDTGFKKGTLYIVKIPTGEIICAQPLINEIDSALSKAGLSLNNFNTIKNSYYNETLDKDNTIIHTDIINTLVSNLKSEIDKINNNNNSGNNNSSGNTGSSNIEVDDNGYVYEDNNEYPSGDISGSDDGPRMDDPTAGQEGIDLSDIIAENTANAGDGGERVDNPDLIIGDGSGNYSNGN